MKKIKEIVPESVIKELKRLKKIGKHECHFVCSVCGSVYPVKLNRDILLKWHYQTLTQDREEIIKEIKKYWYYAGQWHEAECYFISNDQGVCNCDHKKINKCIKLLKEL